MTAFLGGVVISAVSFSTKNIDDPKEKKVARYHNITSRLAYLPIIGLVTSILGAVQMCKIVQRDNKTNQKEKNAINAGIIVGYTIRAMFSTFTGPFVLPFADLTINKLTQD